MVAAVLAQAKWLQPLVELLCLRLLHDEDEDRSPSGTVLTCFCSEPPVCMANTFPVRCNWGLEPSQVSVLQLLPQT